MIAPSSETTTIIPTTAPSDDVTYDYIVIGSGAGGGPLAARLALAGQRVLVIEAGSDTALEGKEYPPETYEVPAFHAVATEDPQTSWSFSVRHYDDKTVQGPDGRIFQTEERGPADQIFQTTDSKYTASQDPSQQKPRGIGEGGIFYPRAAALGGCTSHHAMIIIRPNDSDWEDIANITGDQSWRSENMQGYFPKIENCLYYTVYKGFFGRFLGVVQWLATKINPSLQLDPNGHGSKGWQPTSFIDPLVIAAIARGDRVLKRLLFDVVWSAFSGKGAIQAFKRAATRLQIIQFLDPNVRAKYIASRAHVSLISIGTDGKRRTGLREWLLKVKNGTDGRLKLQTNTHATRLIFAKGEDSKPPRAVGVEVEIGFYLYKASPQYKDRPPGQKVQYFASKEVIVAGGAFNTPQLLMLSGIGDAGHLKSIGIEGLRDWKGDTIAPPVDLPGVGRNLQDRYEVGLISEMNSDFTVLKDASFQPSPIDQSSDLHNTYDPLLKQWRTDQTGLYSTNGGALAFMMSSKVNPRPENPDFFVFGTPAAFRGYYWGWSNEVLWKAKGVDLDQRNLWTWVVLKAYTDNNKGLIKLRSDSPFDVPDINFNSFPHGPEDNDAKALVEIVNHLRQTNERISGMKDEVQPGKGVIGYDLDAWVRKEAWGHHACGTCRMGSDTWRANVAELKDRGAVLDSQFRVHGVQNLRVVDASVFPKIPGYFIVTPVFMISEKAADTILADQPAYPKTLAEAEAAKVVSRRHITGMADGSSPGEKPPQPVAAITGATEQSVPTPKPQLPDNTIGLALSGGGIRSATYCLGVLQALAKSDLLPRIDFLSTVSGGGYIGAFLGRLYTRFPPNTPNLQKQVKDIVINPNSPEIWWLRRHADYLNGGGRADLETDLAVITRNLAATLFCISLLVLAAMGALRWAAGCLFAGNPVWTVAGITVSPWWWAPVIIAALSVIPLAIGYWLTANPGSRWRYSVFGIIAWMVMLGAAITGLGVPWVKDYALAVVGILLLAWLWQEVLRWRKPGLAGNEFPTLYRNRLSRTLGTMLLLLAATVAFVILDSFARLLITGEAAVPYMAGTALLAPPILLFLRSQAIKMIPRGISEVATRLSMPLHNRLMIDVLSFALVALLLLAVDVLAQAAFKNSAQLGIWTTLVALVISIAIGQAINFANLSSLQQTLTQKLTRTFLGASNDDRVHPLGPNAPVPVQVSDDGDDIFFGKYHPEDCGGPLHLINVCINQTVDHLSGRQLRHNKGLAMAVGPLGVSVGKQYHALWKPAPIPPGGTAPPDNRTGIEALPTSPDPNAFHVLARRGDDPVVAEQLSVGRWTAISAAAVSTGAGRNSSLPMSLLLGLVNVRLGYWWNSGINVGDRPGHYPPNLWRRIKSLPSTVFAVQAILLNEWRGYFVGPQAKRWYLSDGGHFDNTGIYELIRRRMPLIIAVDASHDDKYELDDTAILMRQVRLDFGAEIKWLEPGVIVPGASPWLALDNAAVSLPGAIKIPQFVKDVIKQPQSIGSLHDIKRQGTTSAALARVYFSDDVTKSSWLLLIKASLASKVPADVTNYAATNPSFPNQSTADQFFEDDQWESYRSLGECTAKAIF
ncbi:GMC oxidoreductase [Rhizobium leguminosarum]|uniref:GMC oxidoreductase n=1 Tax=Rhizobium leguminosarum TaxID=384 RepID=UPI001441AFFD|nr:GMC oxidoreductase [Rhizobium leguminosarum]NKL66289.1 hypothetical protein [Rhizobium leguminosarum bv. viciae]